MNSLPKIQKIIVTSIEGEEVTEKTLTVSKMPLGRYAEFLEELAKIPKTIAGVVKLLFGNEGAAKDIKQGAAEEGITEEAAPVNDDISNELLIDVVMGLPDILVKHWNDLVKLLNLASGVSVEELNKLDLDEVVQVTLAVVEVNNFFGIKDRYQTLLEKVAISERQKQTIHGKRKK